MEWMKLGGWILSLIVILIGAYFIWPHIHTSLLGIVLIYLGVRIFNFSTFDEHKEKRMKILKSFKKW
jgi:cadmium resistance protein CadD (predicted permease)|tara:strand:+ start:310 stop:510 length:201 start_codon:yes stop_codon:yes gene_type:complete